MKVKSCREVSVVIYTVEEIREKIQPIAEKYQLKAVYLFGSYARNAAKETSDIDLLIDTTGTALKSLFTLGELYCELEEAFQKPIDLITLSALQQRPHLSSEEDFRDTVLNEKVNLYVAA